MPQSKSGIDEGIPVESFAVSVSRASRLALSPNILCRRPARIRCEDYGKIILKRSVHRFNYETFQTLADVGRAHSSNIIVMICHDRLNCGDFLLGSHTGRYGVRFRASNPKRSYFLTPTS